MTDVKRILDKIKKLPPMPEVVGKILRISDDPSISANEIINIIKYDQNITANILRLCNSSYYSLSRTISSLNEAVVLLGNKTLFNVILASVSSGMLNKQNKGYLLEKGKLWEHSVSCAILSKELARRVKFEDDQLAYSTGLMHDAGKVALDNFLVEKAEEIIGRVNEQKEEFTDIENDIFGMSHAEVGAILAENWKFPKAIINGIRYHHTPEQAKEDIELVSIIHVADSMSVMFGFGSGIDGLAYHLSEEALKVLRLKFSTLYELAPILITEVKKAKDLLVT
jgi:putative nucleotidyltransferase with HDIG domain